MGEFFSNVYINQFGELLSTNLGYSILPNHKVLNFILFLMFLSSFQHDAQLKILEVGLIHL